MNLSICPLTCWWLTCNYSVLPKPQACHPLANDPLSLWGMAGARAKAKAKKTKCSGHSARAKANANSKAKETRCSGHPARAKANANSKAKETRCSGHPARAGAKAKLKKSRSGTKYAIWKRRLLQNPINGKHKIKFFPAATSSSCTQTDQQPAEHITIIHALDVISELSRPEILLVIGRLQHMVGS